MKLWKIGLYILCILIVVYWFFYLRREGFQDAPPVTTLNVPYNTKYTETYLVAPNVPNLQSFVPLNEDTLNSDGSLANNKNAEGVFGVQQDYYKDAYSFDDAQGMCENFGATLATPAQMKIAATLNGFWTVAGWASDGKQYIVVPQEMSYSIPNTLCYTVGANCFSGSNGSNGSNGSGSSGSAIGSSPWNPLLELNAPAITKAFPVCWGVKPPKPTMNVTFFNTTDYSMFSSSLLGSVMYPASTDLLQVQFTTDQAVYALQKTNYNFADARALLIGNSPSTGFGNINTAIYQEAVGSDAYAQDISDLNMVPCDILTTTFQNFQTQFNSLRSVMADVSGGVVAMNRSKDENAKFQMELESICYIESPTTSPACSKIATLDFELIYGTTGSDLSTSRLAALELLNVTLFQREQELCMAMNNLFQVQSILKCPSSQGSSPDCVYGPIGSGPNSGSAWTMVGLQPNGEAYLKLKLQEISPYFAISTYKTLLKAIDELSVIISIPTLNDFNTSAQNFSAVNNNIKAIQSYLL